MCIRDSLRIESPIQALIAKEELKLMQDALNGLTADQKMTVKMRLEGALMTEISTQTGRLVGTIKRWVHEATKKLQADLSGKI